MPRVMNDFEKESFSGVPPFSGFIFFGGYGILRYIVYHVFSCFTKLNVLV